MSDDGSAEDHVDGLGEDCDLQSFNPGQEDSVPVYGVHMQ